jgi:hypothetical protein
MEDPKQDDEIEAEARFNETLKRLANTPPKPHKPKAGKPKPSATKPR